MNRGNSTMCMSHTGGGGGVTIRLALAVTFTFHTPIDDVVYQLHARAAYLQLACMPYAGELGAP